MSLAATSIESHHSAERIETLQTLRFIAAALVVFTHAVASVTEVNGHSWIAGTTLEKFGAVGVDLFFVISGFIITRTAMRGPRPGKFMRDRLLRVVPIYWLLSIPAAVRHVTGFGFHPEILLTTLLFWPVWTKFSYPYMMVGWTLSFEMLFYSAMMLVLWRVRCIWLLTCYFVILIAQVRINLSTLHFIGNPIILEFLLGVLIARTRLRQFAGLAFASGIVWFLTSLMIGYGAIWDAGKTINGQVAALRVLVWGIPSALVVYGMINLDARCRGPAWAILGRLGDSSYALYLSHHYVLHVFAIVAGRLQLALDYTLIATAAALLCGHLTYRYIETPLRLSLRRRLGDRRAAVPDPK